jgi:predicted ester cyclase
MKKFLFSIVAGVACIVVSCTAKNEGGMSAAAKKNLEANQAITKCFETGDFSKLGDYIAEDAVDHAGSQGDVKGLANIKTEMEKMMSGMADSKTEIIKELADDEYVMSWMKVSGTLKTDMMGMKAGDKIDGRSIELSRFKDGKVVEHWTFMEPSEFMKMMGGAQQPPADSTAVPVTDTTKKAM